jgi:hypothetical protein
VALFLQATSGRAVRSGTLAWQGLEQVMTVWIAVTQNGRGVSHLLLEVPTFVLVPLDAVLQGLFDLLLTHTNLTLSVTRLIRVRPTA